MRKVILFISMILFSVFSVVAFPVEFESPPDANCGIETVSNNAFVIEPLVFIRSPLVDIYLSDLSTKVNYESLNVLFDENKVFINNDFLKTDGTCVIRRFSNILLINTSRIAIDDIYQSNKIRADNQA